MQNDNIDYENLDLFEAMAIQASLPDDEPERQDDGAGEETVDEASNEEQPLDDVGGSDEQEGSEDDETVDEDEGEADDAESEEDDVEEAEVDPVTAAIEAAVQKAREAFEEKYNQQQEAYKELQAEFTRRNQEQAELARQAQLEQARLAKEQELTAAQQQAGAYINDVLESGRAGEYMQALAQALEHFGDNPQAVNYILNTVAQSNPELIPAMQTQIQNHQIQQQFTQRDLQSQEQAAQYQEAQTAKVGFEENLEHAIGYMDEYYPDNKVIAQEIINDALPNLTLLQQFMWNTHRRAPTAQEVFDVCENSYERMKGRHADRFMQASNEAVQASKQVVKNQVAAQKKPTRRPSSQNEVNELTPEEQEYVDSFFKDR